MKKLIILLVLILAALAIMVPSNASAASMRTVSAKNQPRQSLQAEVRRLIAINTSLRIRNNSLQIAVLNARMQRDTALQGLPNAIRVVPKADFFRLVFSPAYSVYPCRTFLDSGTNWTFTFSKVC